MIDEGLGGAVRAAGDAAADPATPARGSEGLLLRLARPIPVAWRVWLFSGLLLCLMLPLAVGYLHDRSGGLPNLDITWALLAIGFFAAELKVVDVHFRREKHSFSLSEFPAVIAYFLLTPDQYLVALLVGTTAALLITRQSPARVVFNVSSFAFTAAVALSLFYLLRSPAGGGTPDPRDWLAAFAATLVAAALSSAAVATAITLSKGAPQFEKLPEMIQFGSLVAVANTSLALLAVSVLYEDGTLLWLLAVPLVTIFLAYRAYVSEREKHERLELLYQSSRILQHSPELDSALAALLEHAREMFRATRAEILLWPRDESGDGLITIARHDRPTEAMVPMRLD